MELLRGLAEHLEIVLVNCLGRAVAERADSIEEPIDRIDSRAKPVWRREAAVPVVLEQRGDRADPFDEPPRPRTNIGGYAEVARDQVVLGLLGQQRASGRLDESPIQFLGLGPAELVDLVSDRFVSLVVSRVFSCRVRAGDRRHERRGQLRELRPDGIRQGLLCDRRLRNVRLGGWFGHFASRD